MKKNELISYGMSIPIKQELLLTMKLTVLLIFLNIASSYASIFSQELTLDLKKVTFSKAMAEIQGQTKLEFAYSKDFVDLNRIVSLNMKRAPLNEVLDKLLENTDLTYIEIKGSIYIGPRSVEKTANDTVSFFQGYRITGTVVDSASGEPLPGVYVVIKGTNTGTITDVSGNYSLEVPDQYTALSFTYIGYLPKEVMVGGNAIINVSLTSDIQALEEIVIVAFGTQKKETVTGAITSIQTKQIRQTSSASVANGLAGKISGLTSMQSGGGQPGRDDATMYLRGAATINGTDPLILIDGVPRDNIRTIDPNEIASISVLKDASATALFGVRGANGVILITTRRGEKGKMQLNMTAEQSFTSFTREPERLHSVDYMQLRNEALVNDGFEEAFDQETIYKYANPLQGLDPDDPDYEAKARMRRYIYCDHDYYREYILRYAPQTRINLSANGGTDKTSYFVNATYLHQGGNLNCEPKLVLGYDPSSKMDRFSFRANLDFKIAESVKAFLNIGSYIEQVNMPAAWLYGNDTNWMMSDLLYQAQTILPITPGPTTIAGFGIEPGQIVDPGYMDRSAFEIMNRMGYRKEVRSNLNSSFGIEWDLEKVTPGLSVKGMVSYDSKSTTAMQGGKSERLYTVTVDTENDTMYYAEKRNSESLLSISKGADSRYNINIQGSINYNRTFNSRHDVGAMILAQRDYWESTAGEIPYNVIGICGRVTYGYDQRYLGEVNIGYNGSEQFSPDKRFGLFPAVSIGWVVSNEDFLKSNTYLTNLKIRASYGKVGNDQIGNERFLYQDDISLSAGTLGSLGNSYKISEGLLGNKNLSWEISEKQNYGIDIRFMRDISLTFDYYVEKRSNILITRGMVPALQGVSLDNIPKVNLGKVENRGYEVELTYSKSLGKDLSFIVKGNYSYNNNKRTFMDEAICDETYAYRYRQTGYSIGQAWGYKIDYSNGNGFFNTEEELNEYLDHTKYDFGTPRVGDFKYVDLNEDGVINSKDYAPIGYSSIPRVTFGLTISVNYKSFDFSALFQGVRKYSSNYAAQGVCEYIIKGTYFDYHRHAWTPERYANGEDITYPALSTLSNTNHVSNDFFIMNRSFTRLKNIELGYTLPEGTLRKIGVQNLRIYVSGQNLFTWDNLRMGHLDPENNNPIGYPVTRMKNIGLEITF